MQNTHACSFDGGALIQSFSGEWLLALYLPDEDPTLLQHSINRVFGEIVTIELMIGNRQFILDLPRNEVTYALRCDLIGGRKLTIFVMGYAGGLQPLSCASLTVCQDAKEQSDDAVVTPKSRTIAIGRN